MLPDKPHYGSMAREKIISALLSLMENHPFDEITILQITQSADVARRTYYMHYKTKLDVLNDYYDVLAKEYYSTFDTDYIKDTHMHAEMFFTFWEGKRAYLQLLNKHNLLSVLMSRLHEYLYRMIDEDNADKDIQYYTAFYAGGLWAILLAWIDGEFIETPAELADIAVRFDYKSIFRQIPIK